MKKIFCFLFLYIIANLAAIAQQVPQFTFNKATLLSYNPGSAGNEGMVNGVLLNRWQFSGMEGAPKTLLMSVGAETNIFGVQSGVGLNVMSDEIGLSKDFNATLDYAFRKKTGLGMLGIGASFGIYGAQLEGGDLEVPQGGEDLYDENTSDDGAPDGALNQMVLDMGFGIFIRNEDYYAGASVAHINQASFSYADHGISYLVRHYYLSGGYNIKMADPLFEIQPSLLFKTDMVTYQADMTVDLVYNKRYSAGLNYRINDGFGVLLGFEMANGLRVGFAYDIVTSALSSATYGSQELYLGYSFDLGKNRSKKYKSVRFL